MTTKHEEQHMYACHRAVTEMYDGTGLSAWEYLGQDYCDLIAEEFLTLLRNQELNDAERWAELQSFVWECAERVRDNHIDKFEAGADLDYVAEPAE